MVREFLEFSSQVSELLVGLVIQFKPPKGCWMLTIYELLIKHALKGIDYRKGEVKK